MSRINVFICFFLLSIVSIFPQSDLSTIFNRFEINVKDNIKDIFTKDLNEDNLEDLLIITESSKGKDIYIFLQKESGYLKKPDQILKLDSRVIFFDFGNIIDKYKEKEIICLTKDSAIYYYLKDNLYHKYPEILMKISSLFQSTSRECPVRARFIFNSDRENTGMILIPDTDFMRIYKKNKDEEFKESQRIKIKPHFTISSNLNLYKTDLEQENFSQKINVTIPKIYLVDFNGDKKKKDFLSVYKDKIKVFFSNKDKKYSLEPDLNIDLEILTEEEKKKKFQPTFDIKVVDLNNDGLTDIIVTKAAFYFTASMAKVYIYLNKNGNISSTPDQIIVIDNSFGDPDIADLNNDGHKDLIITEYNIGGISQIIKILISNKASFTENIYLRKNDKYADRADYKLKGKVKIDLKNTENSRFEFMYFDADFTGDSIKDLFRTNIDNSKINIYQGDLNKKDLYSKKPAYESKEIILPEDFIIKDLNGDKKQDIIFDYRKIKLREKVTVILLSK